METKMTKYLAIILMIAFIASGCGLMYEKNIDAAYSKLKIGMTKNELNSIFKDAKFLKEQTVLKYPNSTNEDMSHLFEKYNHYEELYPKDFFKQISYNGDIKVASYFIKKNLAWPNGWDIYYASVFYNVKDGKIIGWAKFHNNSNIVKNWDEKF